MSTLREFSQALYNFHSIKAGEYKSIETLCSVAHENFMEEFDKIDDGEFKYINLAGATTSERKKQLKMWLDEKMSRIDSLVKHESDNDLSAAPKLYELLFDKSNGLPKYKHVTSTLAARTDFFRVRDAEKYVLYDRKGMFVLSDDLENKVGAYRFNPSGYACLYLASNLYLAWEECRRPNFDTVNFSRFQNTKEVEVLDLTIHDEYKYREHFLMSYLALLCGAKTTDKDKHNFQYVVPQMMMKVLASSQRKLESRKKDKLCKKKPCKIIAGIRYMSSRRFDQKDLLFDDKRLTIAYVFPQHPHDDKHDICPYLASLFWLTEPRTYFLFKTHRFNFFTRSAYVSSYQDSLFYQLENELSKEKLAKYDK